MNGQSARIKAQAQTEMASEKTARPITVKADVSGEEGKEQPEMCRKRCVLFKQIWRPKRKKTITFALRLSERRKLKSRKSNYALIRIWKFVIEIKWARVDVKKKRVKPQSKVDQANSNTK